jgi:hypothetical protein
VKRHLKADLLETMLKAKDKFLDTEQKAKQLLDILRQ